MIRLICLFVMSAVLLPLSAQDKKAQKHNLKSITVYEQKSDKGKLGKTLPESQTTYDASGNVIEEIEYSNGKVSKHLTYQYNENNDRIRETEFDNLGNKIKVTEYKYNNGLRSEKSVYNGAGQLLSRKTYKYETY
jgi:antitoxin component YwqK of YwqJK toxin-antitoxin module